MCRIAVVVPGDSLRAALVRIADAGTVQLDGTGDSGTEPAARHLRRPGTGQVEPVLSAGTPDLDFLEHEGRADLLAGEAQLREYAAAAVRRGSVVGLAGWCPASEQPELAARLADLGAAVVALPVPRGVDPPTSLRGEGRLRPAFAPLVSTYGTPPYPDADPTLFAGIAYTVMFGMMFGDAGHGALLIGMAALLRAGRPRRLARLRQGWPFVAGAGLAAVVFGLLYGEFFGPTGAVPVLWLEPLGEPVRLLAAAVALGGVLLAAAYVAGIVNRWREGGPRLAIYAPSGIAGAATFLGLAMVAGGGYFGQWAWTWPGAGIAVVGLVLASVGLFAASGGRVAGAVQAAVQVVDVVIRLGANLMSFARLAAFGMTHAALGRLVWSATVALAGGGWPGVAGAVIVFGIGNVLAFALEALVAGVQALRLEFYELFSRVFEYEGRPFRPWHLPIEREPAETEALP